MAMVEREYWQFRAKGKKFTNRELYYIQMFMIVLNCTVEIDLYGDEGLKQDMYNTTWWCPN